MLDTTRLLARVDELISLGEKSLANTEPGAYGNRLVQSSVFNELRSSSLSFIEMVYGRSHTYFGEFDKKVEDVSDYYTKYAIGILRGIRTEIAGGWLTTMRGLIASEFFSDFLEMADHLLKEGYKDPAAVLAGSVLEEHLRQLAGKHGVNIIEKKNGKDVRRKADTLNADLTKAKAYNVLEQKSVTAWLDLRNKAAHGNYQQYTAQQVEQLIEGIGGFLTRNQI